MSAVNGAVFLLFAAIVIVGVTLVLAEAAEYERNRKAQDAALAVIAIIEADSRRTLVPAKPSPPYGDAMHKADNADADCDLCRKRLFPHVAYTGYGWPR